MYVQFNKIFHDLLNAYGDLEKPDFHFAMKSYRSLKYQSVLNDTSSLFNITDHTDLN